MRAVRRGLTVVISPPIEYRLLEISVVRSDAYTLIPRLSGHQSYGHFGIPGTLWASFSGNITTLLSLFVAFVGIVTPYAIT